MSGGCALCVDPDGECVVPFVGPAPLPSEINPYSKAFLPGIDNPGIGTYWCPLCGTGKPTRQVRFRQSITHERLRELLDYNPISGVFISKVDTKQRRAGDIAGSLDSKGYLVFSLDGIKYRANRIAWFYVHNKWPTRLVDHKNRIKSDNSIKNLRELETKENCQNRLLVGKNNKSTKTLGVSAHRGKFCAQICVDGKNKWLGYFGTVEEASAAYMDAKSRIHNYFFTSDCSDGGIDCKELTQKST